MQAIFETLFDAVYLVTVIMLGIIMIRRSGSMKSMDAQDGGAISNGSRQYLLFGIMAVTMGAGDAFHLVPRALALCTTGMESYTAKVPAKPGTVNFGSSGLLSCLASGSIFRWCCSRTMCRLSDC